MWIKHNVFPISVNKIVDHVAGPDNRCFLETGGSAESFFVSEDLPINSVIGKLTVQIIHYCMAIIMFYEAVVIERCQNAWST